MNFIGKDLEPLQTLVDALAPPTKALVTLNVKIISSEYSE